MPVFGPCTVIEHYLEPEVWLSTQTSTLTVNDTGIVWNATNTAVITHYTQIQKIVVTKGVKLKLKLCIQDNQPRTPGIVFLFGDRDQRDSCEQQLKAYRNTALRQAKQKELKSLGGGIHTGFVKRSAKDDVTPRVQRAASSSSSSSSSSASASASASSSASSRRRSNHNHSLTKITQSQVNERTQALARDPALNKQYEELVVKQNVITSEEFWESRQQLVDLTKEQHRAAGNTNGDSGGGGVSAILDPSFSLFDLEKDSDGNYLINSRTVPKLYGLYPWLLQAFTDQVPHKKTREQFWKEFLSYVHTHSIDGTNVVELKGLEGSTYSSYYSNYEQKREVKRRKRAKADAASLISEVGGVAALHAEDLWIDQRQQNDGYGIVGKYGRGRGVVFLFDCGVSNFLVCPRVLISPPPSSLFFFLHGLSARVVVGFSIVFFLVVLVVFFKSEKKGADQIVQTQYNGFGNKKPAQFASTSVSVYV